jgi:shikimate dehydrogenase
MMTAAANMGAKTKNGIEMLHLQAEAAWDIWNK